MQGTIRTLKIIYWALLLETLIFFGVVLFMNAAQEMEFINLSSTIFLLTCAGIVPASVVSSYVLSGMLIRKLKLMEDSAGRMKSYIAASIIRWAILEGAMLMVIVFFLMDKAFVFAIIFAFLILMYLTFFPTRFRISNETGVDLNETFS